MQFDSGAKPTVWQKNEATKIAPNPIIAVFGMTLVMSREFAMLVQCFKVKPGSVGRPGTNVMYNTKPSSATTPDSTTHVQARGK